MNYFKSIVILVSLVAAISPAFANIPVFTDSIVIPNENSYTDDDLGEFELVADREEKNRAELIKDAALASSAAYTVSSVVAQKSAPTRKQENYEHREAMIANGEQIVSFSADIQQTIAGKLVASGQTPAGIISILMRPGTRPRITVAFHGTESMRDLLTDANFFRRESLLLQHGRVHGGFLNRYMESREAMIDVIESLLFIHGLSIEEVDFLATGHSLGAALATLAALDIKKNLMMANSGKLDLVTFSSPRLVDRAGAREIERVLEWRVLRIARARDLVVSGLIGRLGYKHVNGKNGSITLEYISAMPSMKNHALKSILEDAISQENVRFETNHVGIVNTLSAYASEKIQNMSSVFNSLFKVPSLFSW